MPFVGTVNKNMRYILADVLRDKEKLPAHILCSGNFTIERTLYSLGYEQIFSNDVSLYSSVLGSYFAGDPIQVGLKDGEMAWLGPYLTPGVDTVATMILCLDMFAHIRRRNPYELRMWNEYLKKFEDLHNKTKERVTKYLEGFKIIKYTPMDCIEYLQDLDKNSLVMAFPPTYKGGYEKLYKYLDQTFHWEAPIYPMLDNERYEELIYEITQFKQWIIYGDKEIEALEDNLIANVQTKATSFYSTTQAKGTFAYAWEAKKKRLVMPEMKTEPIIIERLRGEVSGDLEVRLITPWQLNSLRAMYMKVSIDPGYCDLPFIVTVGGKLIGCVGFTMVNSGRHWNGIDLYDAYIICDFAIRPSIYKRLSKLVIVAALSKELKVLMEIMHQRRIYYIGTSVFSDYDDGSMKYRGLFEPKKERSSGSILYLAEAGRWSLKEGFEWWKKHHSQKREAK